MVTTGIPKWARRWARSWCSQEDTWWGGTSRMISSTGSLKIVSSIASIGSWRTDTDPMTGAWTARSSCGSAERRAVSACVALSCRSGWSGWSSARAGFSTINRNCTSPISARCRMASRSDLVGSAVSVTTRTRWVRISDITGSSDLVRDGGALLALLDGLGAVPVGHGQVDHDGQDRAQEHDAGAQRPQPESAVGAGRGEVVADVGTERTGQDVGQPEGKHRSHAQLPGDQHGQDEGQRQEHGLAGGPAGELEGPVADRRTEGEGDEHRQPVEGLAGCGDDGVDRQGVL